MLADAQVIVDVVFQGRGCSGRGLGYFGAVGAVPDYPAVQTAAGAAIATHCARLAGGTSGDALWPVAADLETSTLFGGFRIDPASGAQVKHRTVLVRWTDGGLAPIPASLPAHP